MRPSSTRLAATLLLALTGIALSAAAGEGARRHTRLVRSIPARDSVVRALPPRLQLWFSEAIELPLSRVRLEGPGPSTLTLEPLTRAGNDAAAPVTAPFPDSLPDGRYLVRWSTASRDGHVVRDSFPFTLRRR